MKWYIYNWPIISAIMFVALIFLMGLWGIFYLDTLSLILVYQFMALLAHQCEEYIFPGGAQAGINILYGADRDNCDRYPINAANGALINTIGFAFYIAAITFPQATWLGLAIALFGFIELIIHGIPLNLKLKSLYNPGLATSICLFLPLGIYYIVYVTGENQVSGADWLWALVTLAVGGGIGLGYPILGLRNRNTHYPFMPEQMNKFRMMDKLKMRKVI